MRRKQHESFIRKGGGNPFNREAARLGLDSFTFEIIETCESSERLAREKHHIAALGALAPNGFNAQKDPTLLFDYVWTEEMRAAQSARATVQFSTPEGRDKLRQAHLGKHLTPEHRAKVSASLTGRTVTPETRAKISAKHLGRKKSPEHAAKCAVAAMGRKHSTETRLKMSLAHSGKPKSASQIAKFRKSVTGRKCTPEQVERIRHGTLRAIAAKRAAAQFTQKLIPAPSPLPFADPQACETNPASAC